MTLDAELTQFYQGLVSGTRPGNFDYSGRLDAFVTLDTGRLGLWKGGGLHSHLEHRFGDDTAAWGGSLLSQPDKGKIRRRAGHRALL